MSGTAFEIVMREAIPKETLMERELLDSIRQNLSQKQESFRIQGNLHLTKSAPAYCDVVLLRDFDLEEAVKDWISDGPGLLKLMTRYQLSADEPISTDAPDHYAMRVLSGQGAICSGRNIFLFFPNCLGVTGLSEKDFFGMELIDIWRNVFEKVVFPCARTVLVDQSLISTVPPLLRTLDKTIYLASVFHEIGHRVGPWKVSPKTHSNLKISNHLLDVMGELSTDSLLVQNLKEFPEICSFVTLQRLFWFGRRGYLDNPKSAWINQDNDSWITACLWNELVKENILAPQGSKWILNTEKLPRFYGKLYHEIETLGLQVLQLSSQQEQDNAVLSWMKTKVDWNEEQGFVLPRSLQKVFSACARLPEIPTFHPILDLNHEELV